MLLHWLAGCAAGPWNEPLDENQTDKTLLLVDALAARDAHCAQSISGDLTLTYKSPVDDTALVGFLEFSLPSSFKFVLTNPLGQPVFAVAGDQKTFAAINTRERKYFAGSLQAFGVRNNIDTAFLQGDWGDWLTGRNRLAGQNVTDLRYDRDGRGIWLTFPSGNDGRSGAEHLLLAPDKELYQARIIENEKREIVAEIAYSEWTKAGVCWQPLDIRITKLDYGAEIHLKLSDIIVEQEPEKYTLPVPDGYLMQFMP
ncbi:MAG: hypothetical protein ACWGOX_05060 [Desulforhopalus sp.]